MFKKILLSLIRKNGTYLDSLEKLDEKELYDVVKKILTTKNPEVEITIDKILGREPQIDDRAILNHIINNDPNKFDEFIEKIKPHSFNYNFDFKVPTNLIQEKDPSFLLKIGKEVRDLYDDLPF